MVVEEFGLYFQAEMVVEMIAEMIVEMIVASFSRFPVRHFCKSTDDTLKGRSEKRMTDFVRRETKEKPVK